MNISEMAWLPAIGFGTADLAGPAERIVLEAISAGHRLIDTARVYGSEEGVGLAAEEAVRRGIVRREELFLETKLAPDRHGYHEALRDFEEALERMRTDYLDMFMLHWPVARGSEDDYREKNIAAWQALTELKQKGRVRHIGVCNFLERHLLQLTDAGLPLPEVNQLELHPGFQQRGLVRFCRERGMAIEAWSPMGRGILKTPEFEAMAARYGKDVGQLALRWSIQKGFVPLTRSSDPEHIAHNLEIFDFEIGPQDTEKLDALNTNTDHQDIWSYKRQQMY